MKARTWIVIGIVFLVFMSINNVEFYTTIITEGIGKLVPRTAGDSAGGILLTMLIIIIPIFAPTSPLAQ